jgi:hypothetical protein
MPFNPLRFKMSLAYRFRVNRKRRQIIASAGLGRDQITAAGLNGA